MTDEAVQTVGPSAEQLKKKANAQRWAKIGGVVFAVAMVVRGVSMLLPKEMPSCGDSEVQSTTTQLMNEGLTKNGLPNTKVATITDPRFIPSVAQAALLGGSAGPVTQAYIDTSGDVYITATSGGAAYTSGAGQVLIGTYTIDPETA